MTRKLDRDQCTRCARVVDLHDQDAEWKHGVIVACGSCKPSELSPNPPPKKRRSTTSLIAANRYLKRFPGTIIGQEHLRAVADCYEARQKSGYFFVAEIPSMFSPRR